jgi:hypothetical protein
MLEGEDIPGERALPTPTVVQPVGVAPAEVGTEDPAAAGVGTLLEQWLLPERNLPRPK